MCYVNLVVFEDVFDFKFEQFFVGENILVVVEYVIFWVVLNGVVELCFECVEIGLGEYL